MGRYRATVAYDGTRYKGFQIQTDCLTIQGEIERALRQITQASVRIAGSGRTDAGVHAQGQVVTFDSQWRHGDKVLERALNAVLPADIAVRQLTQVAPRFHARFSAVQRTYVYHAFVSAVREPMLERYAMRLSAPPRLDRMQGACKELVGEHDFAAMGQAPAAAGSTVRRVSRAQWERSLALDDAATTSEGVERFRFTISANGFLRGMVRRIVGTLLEVGAERMSPAEFAELIESRDISAAAAPAAACGLVLWQVDYDPDSYNDGS